MDKFIIEKLQHYIQELEKYICMESKQITALCYHKEDDSSIHKEGDSGFHKKDDSSFYKEDTNSFHKPDYDDSKWSTLSSGQEWGGRDKIIWIRGKVTIQEQYRGEALDLRIEAGPREAMDIKAEALLYLNGIESCAFDNWHSRMRLDRQISQEKEFKIALRVWSGMNEEQQKRHFEGIWLERVHEVTEKYYYLAKILLETIQELGQEDYRRIALIKMVDGSLKCIDYLKEGSEGFYQSIGVAYQFLKKELENAKLDIGEKPTVAVCGHTHIDMAWLWQLCHTTDKGARSFSTVLHLMERYPEYKFSQSSPLLYEMVREKYPSLFERIKEKIREGRWEITGGMWVEPDTNIPSGESLVRQLLYGKRYIKKEFGKETTVLWLPDVFGYSWVLPQILKKSGITLFWTNKMSWNQYNKIPYDTFRWRGMDGSELLTQLGTCPEKNVTWGTTYNGVIAPFEVKGTWDMYQQKDLNQEVLMPFGWGDGGGGATREMLEAYEIMGNLPGLPQVKMKHIEEFADNLEKNLEGKEVPIWDGELYFEYHRGTYTSQAFVKRANRKAEVLYHDIELFSAIRNTLTGEQAYPSEDLEKNWKNICKNQFHDIIPGSGIAEVYEDAAESYRDIHMNGKKLLSKAVGAITKAIKISGDAIVVYNSQPWERKEVIHVTDVPKDKILMDGEREVVVQYHQENGELYADYLVDGIPSCGYKTLHWKDGAVRTPEAPSKWERVLNTRYYRLEFNQHGQIIRIYDKEFKREVLKKGGLANELCVFEDKPHQFEAWNTEIYALEKYTPITELEEAKIMKEGPLKTVLTLKYRFHESVISKTITVYQHSRKIRFDTWCDWQETHALLKASFDVDIRSTQAVYDIQFGNLQRVTHSNTAWDYAQFEVCAHKWADLSEGNYGVTLINDCKYGHDIKDSKMRLTLIKTSSYPDKNADLGGHVFSYALLPHGGSWKEAESDKRAYEFNFPVHVQRIKQNLQGCLPERFSFVWTDSKNIIIETVKKAEDENAWVVRAYECMRFRGNAAFYFGSEIKEVTECNLMEEEICHITSEGNRFICEMSPYEIKTFKVQFM